MARRDDAFSDFARDAWPRLYRTAYLLLADHGHAEDLVQTALAKVYLHWGRIRDADATHAYARTVVVNTANSWFRRRGWNAETVVDAVPEHPLEPVDTDTSLTLEALRRLPDRQRAVVVLRFYEDLSVEQTADALNISTGTVKSQTSHALAKLRALLGDSITPTLEGTRHD
ncbi:SigE family RNA polymerase sigma factor [Mumia zhuanghuii]|uniref:SigE family RNA polymerase sigma factor n=2 Tax=Mumia TaxID=1546255 RepID=A0ABW1QJU3_9ACTN|nr:MULTISPECIES: SigE family RNA polymerase sigma factor [Mumia]KAA1418350.1 SigE family RNA polymerase sigma factor [Mumia zhuanghuii]